MTLYISKLELDVEDFIWTIGEDETLDNVGLRSFVNINLGSSVSPATLEQLSKTIKTDFTGNFRLASLDGNINFSGYKFEGIDARMHEKSGDSTVGIRFSKEM